jgi:hypothetical protein
MMSAPASTLRAWWASASSTVLGVAQVAVNSGRQLPLRVFEHGRNQFQREAQAAQQADPVEPSYVAGVVEPVACGRPP